MSNPFWMLNRSRVWTPELRQLDAAGKFKHGTTYGYWKGCPCEDCRRANREAQRMKRGGIGTRWQESPSAGW